MAKKTIAIISVLKPIEDSRHFEKMALSIGQTNKYDVNIIGFGLKKISTHPNVCFYPLGKYGRMHPKRWFARVKTMLILFKLKPEIVIANTHELLIVMILNKILFGSKAIYDIQENYYRNIRHGHSFVFPFNIIIGYLVRCKERLLLPFIDLCYLAERSYLKEMPYLQPKSVLLENKYKPSILSNKINYDRKNQLIFAYTGTISVNYGIFDALNFMEICVKYHPDAQLIIHGYCADATLRKNIMDRCNILPYVRLITSDEPLPHKDILDTLKSCNFALLPYHLGPEIQECIPTKLYECLALHKPVIIRDNPTWRKVCDPYNAALFTDFKHFNDLFPLDASNTDMYKRLPGDEILWSSEEVKLIDALHQL